MCVFFYNPFPMWYIILVVIPFQLLAYVTSIPQRLLRAVGLNKASKYLSMIHFYAWEHLQQLVLEPRNYFKNIKSINRTITQWTKEFSKH